MEEDPIETRTISLRMSVWKKLLTPLLKEKSDLELEMAKVTIKIHALETGDHSLLSPQMIDEMILDMKHHHDGPAEAFEDLLKEDI